MAPRVGSNKITLEGYNHLTWRYKIIPYIRTDSCTDMSNMFSGANYSLPETLDLRNFNTANVITMNAMFDNCVSEHILGLNIFNTSNVEDMSFMFNESKATELNLSSFDTSNVTTMENMFCNCGATFNAQLFNTTKVTNMKNMFKGTSGTTLDLTNYDTSSVVNMSGMFCNSDYTSIDVSSFDTSGVTNMYEMFRNSNLEELDISTFNMSNVINVAYMLADNNLTQLILPSVIASNTTSISGLFYNLTIPNLDLRNIKFPNATHQSRLFSGLTTGTLDLSTWDLGASASNERYSPTATYAVQECLFNGATIDTLRFSNSNVFPEGYNVCAMFSDFKTSGTLDLSHFYFNKCTYGGYPEDSMFRNSQINTLIMGDVTTNEFDFELRQGNEARFFRDTTVELLDMSDATLTMAGSNCFFDGLTATRINMPNKIPVQSNGYASTGRAKYVDYSSVDTTNTDYTDNQWYEMAGYVTKYNKIVWVPSTFILDGNHTMDLSGDVYTDALSYSDLGWSEEPSNAIMHYGATHSDFEQAILDDDTDEWISPLGNPIFFCHTSVPLNSPISINQFEDNYSEVYYDDALIDLNNFTFNQIGNHTLKIIINGYTYKQRVSVVDHGDTYTVVGYPKDYIWNTNNKRYVDYTSTYVQCRLYPDKYLFIYPIGRVQNSNTQYTVIASAPSTTITKVSGVPFGLNQLKLSGCNQLNDISELIVCPCKNTDSYGYSHGFNPNNMFSNCTSLTDVSVIDKWVFSTNYYYNYKSGSSTFTTSSYYSYSDTFYNTRITSAPKITITSGSAGTFSQCTNLSDISKISFTSAGTYSSDGDITFTSIFNNCSALANVSRLKQTLQGVDNNRYLELNNLLANTAIIDTDFIPDDGLKVSRIDQMFYGCSRLTNLSGLSRLDWKPTRSITLTQVFSGTPATDYSALSGWTKSFTEINFTNTKMSDLSFMSNWNLSNCVYYIFDSCNNLTSISDLSGLITTSSEVTVNLQNCSALTSLVGLEGCELSANSTFNGCSALTSLNGLQGCTIKNGSALFANCTSLADITALAQVTFAITNIDNMFYRCTTLTSLNGLQGLDISNVTQLVGVFRECSSLNDIDAISGWNPYQVKNVNYLFYGCSSITSFSILSGWITAQLTNAIYTFYGCSSITDLAGLRGFNFGQCQSLTYMFANCTSLEDITAISAWYVSNITNMSYMFNMCTALLSITPIKNWNISGLTDMSSMFDGDISITDADVLEDWKNIKAMTTVTRSYAFRNVPRPWPTWAVS